MVGVAAGLASEGYVPFIYSIAPFDSLRCLEQIRNNILYNDLSVKIVGVGAGYSYGVGGSSHHGIDDLSVMKCLPGISIVTPCDPIEAYSATLAVFDNYGCHYLRLGRGGENTYSNKNLHFEIGKENIITKGSDITIFITGAVVSIADEIRQKLEHSGISCEIVSLHTNKPFNKKPIMDRILNRKLLVSIEENNKANGLGISIKECLFNTLNVPFLDFSIENPIKYVVGSQDYLREISGLSSKGIYNEIIKLL
jgi:transketolase